MKMVRNRSNRLGLGLGCRLALNLHASLLGSNGFKLGSFCIQLLFKRDGFLFGVVDNLGVTRGMRDVMHGHERGRVMAVNLGIVLCITLMPCVELAHCLINRYSKHTSASCIAHFHLNTGGVRGILELCLQAFAAFCQQAGVTLGQPLVHLECLDLLLEVLKVGISQPRHMRRPCLYFYPYIT